MDHYGIQKAPQTPLAMAALLAEIEAPWSPARHPQDQMLRIYEAAKRVREAEAADEVASWRIPREPRIYGNTVANPQAGGSYGIQIGGAR